MTQTPVVTPEQTPQQTAEQTAGHTPAARTRRAPEPWLLSPTERHLVSRFSYGITPKLAVQVRSAGGADAWFDKQLRVRRDKSTDQLESWFPSMRRGAAELWQRQIDGVEAGYEVMDNYARWVLMRRITTRNPVLELMAEFWENHLHVSAVGDAQFVHRVDYGNQLRKRALGTFSDLLLASTTHPAMLIYLDAASSTKEHPNENLGRELLELHTLGAGNYSEKDVRDSARILTGFSVDAYESWRPTYSADDHYTGTVKVKGFRDRNKRKNGKALTSHYLKYLARHPDTAEHLATKLCVKFIDDEPDKRLVKRLARVYLENDTAVVPVLRALVAAPAFRASAGRKVRDPGEDLVATYRVMGVKLKKPTAASYDGSALQALPWSSGSIGQRPFAWGPPNGQPIDDESWSSPARLLSSMRFHMSVAEGWADNGTGYREPKQWLPEPAVRFDELVDHLSQSLLHRRASTKLVKACSVAVDVKPHEFVTKDSDLLEWGFGRLLTTLLDSPDHLSR